MTRPILSGSGWQVRICRPAFLLVEREGELHSGVRILFCEHSPTPNEPTLWVLGGMRIDEELGELQRTIYSGRSLILQARAD